MSEFSQPYRFTLQCRDDGSYRAVITREFVDAYVGLGQTPEDAIKELRKICRFPEELRTLLGLSEPSDSGKR
jgi:hypothetical protein